MDIDDLKDINLDEIVAMIPIYGEYGEDMTRIMVKDDELVVDMRLKPLVRTLLKRYWLDLDLMRSAIAERMFIQNNAPIILGNNSFACLKLRKPKVTGDSAYGFVKADDIADIDGTGSTTRISLSDGRTITASATAGTVKRGVYVGKLLRKM